MSMNPEATSSPPGAAILRLDEIRLRGIGSYRNCAALPIRPLTILCGANGSGKSTWIRILEALRSELDHEEFPARRSTSDTWLNDISLTNAFWVEAYAFPDPATEGATREQFGPPGSVTLRMTTQGDVRLSENPITPLGEASKLAQLLTQEYLADKSSVTIRICHPSSAEDENLVPHLEHRIELAIDHETAVLTFFPKRTHEKVTSSSYELSLRGDVGVHPLGPDVNRTICMRVRQLLTLLLDRIFYIGAVRPIDTRLDLSSSVNSSTEMEDLEREIQSEERAHGIDRLRRRLTEFLANEAATTRNVGPTGEFTWPIVTKLFASPFRLFHANLHTCWFAHYLDYWLEKLLRTRLSVLDLDLRQMKNGLTHGEFEEEYTRLREGLRNKGVAVRGVLADPAATPKAVIEGFYILDSDCFTYPQAPKNMSAGTHQVAPFIVQLGLMTSGETLLLENPEVHLHPDLQLAVAEFLITQAIDGRQIVVETHSDLIVRRVVRAVLEEHEGRLSQSSVCIAFTELTADEKGGVFSTLQQMVVDKNGVPQWSKGFMDASIRESQRMLQILFPQEEEEK